MRSLWKGSITFGLINVPIKAFKATENHRITFNLLHRECQNPIQYRRYCPHCERFIENDELVKAHQWQKGKFVIIDEEEIAGLSPKAEHAIEIQSFVPANQIDSIYYEKNYYLSPDLRGQRAYVLLRHALSQTDAVAIARVVMRTQESLASVRCLGDGLVLSLMHYPAEIRPWSEVPDIPEASIVPDEREMQMAIQLIDNLKSDFQPGEHADTFREKLSALIERKISGQEPILSVPLAREGQVVDLMEALKASIEMAKAGRKTGEDKVKTGKNTKGKKRGKVS